MSTWTWTACGATSAGDRRTRSGSPSATGSCSRSRPSSGSCSPARSRRCSASSRRPLDSGCTGCRRRGYLRFARELSGPRLLPDRAPRAGGGRQPPPRCPRRQPLRVRARRRASGGCGWRRGAARSASSSAVISERQMRSHDGRIEPRTTQPLGVRLPGVGPRGGDRLHYPDLLLECRHRPSGRGRARADAEVTRAPRGDPRRLRGRPADRRGPLPGRASRSLGRAIERSAAKTGLSSLVQRADGRARPPPGRAETPDVPRARLPTRAAATPEVTR